MVNEQEELQGVITDWDITRAAALGQMGTATVESAMTRQVISARPDDSILELVHKLDYYEISAMPIVEGKSVLGMISADILARRSLVRLLQAQSENGS